MNKDTTYKHIWNEMIRKEASLILKENGYSTQVFNENAKDDVLNEYDRLRSYAKIEYLRDPDGYSNRYLVCSYLIMAIAKVRPLNEGKNEGNLSNERLALRTGLRLLAAFKKKESEGLEKAFWSDDRIAEIIINQLGKEYEYSLCYYLFYDIEEKTYSILELANIIWIIEAYLLIDVNISRISVKPRSEVKRYVDKRIAYGNMWDDIWDDLIERKAKRIVNQNVGEVVFDKSSKRLTLKAIDKFYNYAKTKYVRLRKLPRDKYMFCACLILAVAEAQPIEYRHDNHDLTGIYNENLAIEVGLSMLFHYTKDEIDYTRYRSRFKFPRAFQNKTFKELLCLMLYYDVKANHYSALAIANILYMIVLYTKASNNINSCNQEILLTYLDMSICLDSAGNLVPWGDGKSVHVQSFVDELNKKSQDSDINKGINECKMSLFVGVDLLSGKMIHSFNETQGNRAFIAFLDLLNEEKYYKKEDRIRLIIDKQNIINNEEINNYLNQNKNPERYVISVEPKHSSLLNMVEVINKMIKLKLEELQVKSKKELKECVDKYFNDTNSNPTQFRKTVVSNEIHKYK